MREDPSDDRFIFDVWNMLSRRLRNLDEQWEVWIEWYNGISKGAVNEKFLFELSRNQSLKLWHDIALIDESLWLSGPAVLNAEFRRLVDEARAETSDGAPFIPQTQPAAIEPIWENERLILPTTPANVDGNRDNVMASLEALKADFAELAEDIGDVANIDRRAAAYFKKLVERIPIAPASNFEMHRIAHNETALQAYGQTVSEEWPNLLAVRYHSLVLQFNRAMAQFPNWRDFKRNAAAANLTLEQIELAPQSAREVASALRQAEFAAVIDSIIPDKLEALAEDVSGVEFPKAGKDYWAADLLTSINNIYIRALESALQAKRLIGDGFLNGLTKGGEWMGIGAVVVPPLGLGIYLCTTFPAYFSWLRPILMLLGF